MTRIPLITRRSFVAGAGAAVVGSRAVWGQAKLPVVAWLGTSTKETNSGYPALLQGMADLGYVQGRDFLLIERWNDGNVDLNVPLLKDLLLQGPDVIVTNTVEALSAASQLTTAVPIVGGIIPETAAAQLIGESLARPKGNVTGVLGTSPGVLGKQIEVLHEALPSERRFGWLQTTLVEPSLSENRSASDAAGKALGLELVRTEARLPEEIAAGFAELVRRNVRGVVFEQSALINSDRRRLVALCAEAKLPAIFGNLAVVTQAGGLMFYGFDTPTAFRRSSEHVVKILGGAKPSSLPVIVASPLLAGPECESRP